MQFSTIDTVDVSSGKCPTCNFFLSPWDRAGVKGVRCLRCGCIVVTECPTPDWAPQPSHAPDGRMLGNVAWRLKRAREDFVVPVEVIA
jgi:hypothetical protein